MSVGEPFPSPEQVLNAFLDDALAFEDWITQQLGNRWQPVFRAIRRRIGRLRFSDETSDAAFFIDPHNGDFVFFNAGFYALRSALFRIVGPHFAPGQQAYLAQLGDVAYGLHEILHPEQGLSDFSTVQRHKNVPSGYDEIGKIDHLADNGSMSLMGAVNCARSGILDRHSYLTAFKDLSYLINRAAPIAFEVSGSSLHKQKRRLVNWLVRERVDDALRHDMIDDIERVIGPVDAPLWLHFQMKTGDVVLWEPEPIHRVLATTCIRPDILREALQFREQMDRGDLTVVWRAILRALGVDAYSVKARLQQELSASTTGNDPTHI